MKRRSAVLVLLTSCLVACQPDISDLQRFTAEVKASTSVSIEPLPTFETQPAFDYSATSMRSPFQRPKQSLTARKQESKPNCQQPNLAGKRHALEKYGLDALSISGTINRNNQTWVLITANDGSLHKAQVGDRIGLFFGEITSITADGITIKEMVPDGAGCWQPKQAKLSKSSQAGENDNV
ncbi:pilus assembly protein PilP [Aestuariibacter sp. AA17]|uniref:Pilus assembly protein PilP n=1 Tax=Fluctibacter corallii TaxID=2984329 RepID=A0ABT3A6U5_9ALTE|nr:pilus assembly protein PilP [Aestuariibacter sp. AA17]MCV2884378.1 pilus assembly protein PilP [Aestuariibacter sp. AA17]